MTAPWQVSCIFCRSAEVWLKIDCQWMLVTGDSRTGHNQALQAKSCSDSVNKPVNLAIQGERSRDFFVN